jgi:hypothetical protein
MEIQYQGQYDKKTFFKAVALANKPPKKNTIFRIGLTVLFILVLVAYFFVTVANENLSIFDVLRAGKHFIGMPVVIYILLQPYISSYFTALKLWNESVIQKPQAGTISNQGVMITSSNGNKEISWNRFAKKQITENLIVLLTSDGVVFIFPQYFFSTDTDWQKTKQWVNESVIETL